MFPRASAGRLHLGPEVHGVLSFIHRGVDLLAKCSFAAAGSSGSNTDGEPWGALFDALDSSGELGFVVLTGPAGFHPTICPDDSKESRRCACREAEIVTPLVDRSTDLQGCVAGKSCSIGIYSQ